MHTEKNFKLLHLRLPTKDKGYYNAVLSQFTENMLKQSPNCAYVEYGKQDARGGFSICLNNAEHCTISQRIFDSKEQMLGFIVGYNQALYRGL